MRRIGDVILTALIMTMVVTLTVADRLRRKGSTSGGQSTQVTTEGGERYEKANEPGPTDSMVLNAL